MSAPPEAGKANAALIALLAKSWRVPKSAVSIARGHRDRDKLLHVAGEPGPLKARLDAWLQEIAP